MNFSSLPPDVVESILISLPDFKSLSAALRTSKRLIYTVFQAHPVSITRAVAYNLVGPALPLAIRVVHLRPSDNVAGTEPGKIPDEDQVMALPLTRDITEVLQENSEVAYHLEDLFSLRFKDRTSRISQLTCKESAVFLEAFYRAWSLTRIMDDKIEDYYLDPDYDEEDDDDDLPRMSQLYAVIGELLDRYDNKQVHQLYDLCLFLNQVARWVVGQDQVAFQSGPLGALLCDPSLLWRAFREETNQSISLERLWKKRKVNADSYVPNRTKAILYKIEGENDTCHRCDRPAGLELWGSTNLDLWRRNMTVDALGSAKFLPGLLSHNTSLTLWLRSVLSRRAQHPNLHTSRPFVFGDMADEIFVIARAQEGDACGWNRDKWYCTECVDELFKGYLWRWILECKRKRGEVPQEDCWYGYNCRTMTHRQEHANKLNHLCMPSRGV